MHGFPASQNHDQYIVKNVLRGERNAFNEIIKLTSRIVAQITFKMIPGAEDRKDVIQDVYLKAWKGLEGFQFKSRLTTWVAQIAYRTCLNYLEGKKINITVDLDYVKEEISSEREHNYNNDIKEILEREIAELPIINRTLITLYHQEELSYEEIAAITSMPVGTVKSYLFRSRKALKEKLLSKYKKDELWK